MTQKNKRSPSVIEIAIKLETDGMKFYREASEKSSHPFGKKMFLSFVEDEKRHITILKELFGDTKAWKEATKGPGPQEKVKTIFTEVSDEIQERIAADPDDIEAIKIALDFEKEGYDFYQKFARETSDPDEKEVFERLGYEESQHFTILQNMYQYLEDTGHWFCHEERGLLDGG